MAVYLDEIRGQLIASGSTYDYKDIFKSLGFRWSSREKSWKHPRPSRFIKVTSQLIPAPL